MHEHGRTFIGTMMLAALTAAAYAGFVSHAPHAYLTAAVLACAAATSRMKVKLPGINGNMSMNLPFLLCLGAAAGLALTTLFKRDRMDVRGLELGAMFAAAALFGFVYFAFSRRAFLLRGLS